MNHISEAKNEIDSILKYLEKRNFIFNLKAYGLFYQNKNNKIDSRK